MSIIKTARPKYTPEIQQHIPSKPRTVRIIKHVNVELVSQDLVEQETIQRHPREVVKDWVTEYQSNRPSITKLEALSLLGG